MQKIWKLKEPDQLAEARLVKALFIAPLIARILVNRGISDATACNSFLTCNYSYLHNPNKLKGVNEAIPVIKKAVKSGKRILVWADYDVDGMTSAAVLHLVLKRLGAKADVHIPHRLKEGYGLNMRMVESFKDKYDLVITIDCGINAKNEIGLFRKNGAEVIVVDHHQPKADKLPDAIIINPLQEGCAYPFKYLAGVGLGYKLGLALLEDEHEMIEHLDLVCLGTIADVVPLTDENRILVKEGFLKLNSTKKEGLLALIEASGLKNKEMNPTYVGYILAPRLNACGRLSSARAAFELLISNSRQEAIDLADLLNDENRLRQKIEAEVMQQAIAQIESSVDYKSSKVLVLGSENWHPGVVGIVASKIAERFYRPAIMFSFMGEYAKGSGRSIENFHLFDALTGAEEHIVEFGGHKMAAGILIKKDKLEMFSDAINKIAHEQLKPEDLVPVLEIDSEVALSDIKPDLVEQINMLGPFGAGNPKPIFMAKNLKLNGRAMTFAKDTLKFRATDGKSTLEALGFRMGSFAGMVSDVKNFDIAFYPAINKFNGIESIQLELKDIRPAQN